MDTKMKATYMTASPYQEDALNLPVKNVETATQFYETVMGFRVVSQKDSPYKYVLLGRDTVQIGLVENGADPSQDGCFFEVDDVVLAFKELNSNGLKQKEANFRIDKHGDTTYKVFFVVAPDGLCYCLGKKQN